MRPTNDLANRPLQPLGYSSVHEHCGFTQAEQGDYIRESVAFTVADEYNTLMHPDAVNQNTPEPGWEFKPGDNTAAPSAEQTAEYNALAGSAPTPAPAAEPVADKTKELSVSWTASEFVLHQKNSGWYIAWALCSVVGVALVYCITREIFSSVLVAIILLALGLIEEDGVAVLIGSVVGVLAVGWNLFLVLGGVVLVETLIKTWF